MLSLMKRAFEPPLPYQDSITYMTSVRYFQSVRADNTAPVIEKIKDLITSKRTRLQGLQLLEIALQQNSDIFAKVRWPPVLYDIMKEPVSSILKEHACKILCLIISFMAKEPCANAVELHKFASFLCPFLLLQIENNVEWIESAAMCLCACLKFFPQTLEPHKDRLISVVFNQISATVSSRTLEVFAECFSYIPHCSKVDEHTYASNWLNHYLTTINSMHFLLNNLLPFLPEDNANARNPDDHPLHPFLHGSTPENTYASYMKGIRQFINLCKCLAKVLSVDTKFAVQIPAKQTLECISRLFQVHDMLKINSYPPELDAVFSGLPQMQVACLVVLESLALNVNLLPYSYVISQLVLFALQSSTLPNISSESVSPLRQAVWKFLDQWVSRNGARVSADIVDHPAIIEECLKDICIENSSQTNSIAVSSKSKKNTTSNTERIIFVNKDHQVVCKEALKALENILYSANSFMDRKMLQEIFTKIVQVAYTISPLEDHPFPYDSDMCRKHLYSALLAITVVSRSDQREPIQCASGIFKFAFQDPSPKVVRVCHRAMAMCKLFLHPKKPIPVSKDSDDKPKMPPNMLTKFEEWNSEAYVQNFPPVESVEENPATAQNFHNTSEGEEVYEESMQVDSTYSEQEVDSQCNGEEDILDIQQTSHELDSDEEDEEEEEEEHSYGEEEINQEEVQTEHLYIPSTSKVLNPVPVAPETEQDVGPQEYEELRPCGKNDDSNKNVHLNGVRNVIEEEMSSPSAQNVASENGIIYDTYEEEDVDEEEGDEDEEEESGSYPAEKKVPEYLDTPAAKKQKLEEPNEEPQDSREGSRSPTLNEMKADFCCNEIDDVKS